MINRITITGPDQMTSPQDLNFLTQQYPAVEWAILVSASQTGKSKRFPGIDQILDIIEELDRPNLSLHLCGSYVRDLLMGDGTFIYETLAPIWKHFQRVQINTHGQPHPYDPMKVVEFLKLWPEKEFIFQMDQENTQVLTECAAMGVNCSGLFDMSHGAGVSPKEWPLPFKFVKCGYAGGIGPENIAREMEKIDQLVGNTMTWIDMETKVRTNEDWLDIEKVEHCLSAHARYLLG